MPLPNPKPRLQLCGARRLARGDCIFPPQAAKGAECEQRSACRAYTVCGRLFGQARRMVLHMQPGIM